MAMTTEQLRARGSESTLRGLVLVIALAALLFPVAAWADTVVLDSGRLTLTVNTGMTSGQGLNASGPDFSMGALSGPIGFAGPSCAFCLPGSLFSTGTGGSGAEFGGVEYAGVFYMVSDIGFLGCTGLPPGTCATAFLGWSAGGNSILMPPIAATFSASVPFFIGVQASLSSCLTCRLDVLATGQGVATFSFVPDTVFPNAWRLVSGVYEIQPIPEPSTWLLVPTAVGLAWLARKKRNAT